MQTSSQGSFRTFAKRFSARHASTSPHPYHQNLILATSPPTHHQHHGFRWRCCSRHWRPRLLQLCVSPKASPPGYTAKFLRRSTWCSNAVTAATAAAAAFILFLASRLPGSGLQHANTIFQAVTLLTKLGTVRARVLRLVTTAVVRQRSCILPSTLSPC